MRVTEKTGLVTAGLRVGDGDDIMLMTNTGQSVRIRVSDIRITGRNASGVKLMNLKEGETIQDIALVVRDGDEDDDARVAALPETDPSEVEEEIIDEIEEEDDEEIVDDEGDEEEEK
jgi:DNA gyrase subunit A